MTGAFETGTLKLIKECDPVAVATIYPLEIDPAIAEFLKWGGINSTKVIIGFRPLLDHPYYSSPNCKTIFATFRARF